MDTVKFRRIRNRFFQENRKTGMPSYTVFELTHKCNHKCIHCYNVPHPEKKEMTTEEVFDVIDQLRKMNIFLIYFTGGEIFTRPDALKILWHAKKNGIIVYPATNGALLTGSTIKELVKMGVRNMGISFLSMLHLLNVFLSDFIRNIILTNIGNVALHDCIYIFRLNFHSKAPTP